MILGFRHPLPERRFLIDSLYKLGHFPASVPPSPDSWIPPPPPERRFLIDSLYKLGHFPASVPWSPDSWIPPPPPERRFLMNSLYKHGRFPASVPPSPDSQISPPVHLATIECSMCKDLSLSAPLLFITLSAPFLFLFISLSPPLCTIRIKCAWIFLALCSHKANIKMQWAALN